jgi:hypothetical protein
MDVQIRQDDRLAGYKFTIMTQEEMDSLRWLAGRYDSAQLLYDCIGDPERFPCVVTVPEHVVWNVIDATEGDGGDKGVVPCLGGRLGKEIHAMLQSVV